MSVTEDALIEMIFSLNIRSYSQLRQHTEAGAGCMACRQRLVSYIEQYASAGTEPPHPRWGRGRMIKTDETLVRLQALRPPANGNLPPPNDDAQQLGRLERLQLLESRHAGLVCFNALFGPAFTAS